MQSVNWNDFKIAEFLSEVDKKFGLMPFSLRLCEDEKKAKMGVVECVKHELMQPFTVLYERDSKISLMYGRQLLH